jgi:hypothetical protein
MELDLITFGVLRDAGELLLATGGILGLTAMLGKVIPDDLRDKILPFAALGLGVLLSISFQLSHSDPVTVQGILFGIVFGGSVTGLYTVTKEIRGI